MAANATVSSVAANTASFYSHAGKIETFANGPLSLQAHADWVEILADHLLNVASVSNAIEVKACKKIVLQAGQASATLAGRNTVLACRGS